MSSGQRVPLVSTARHVYGGRSLRVNEFFWAENQQDADELMCKALRFARPALPHEIPKEQQTYDTKPLKVEAGDYERADLEAELNDVPAHVHVGVSVQEALAQEAAQETEDVDDESKQETNPQPFAGNRSARRQHQRRDLTGKK